MAWESSWQKETLCANCKLRGKIMATKVELQKRIAELEVERARADTLYQISHDLNTARDEDELLQVLIRPAQKAGGARAMLLYIDMNKAGEPEWLELVARWGQTEGLLVSAGVRYYLPEFPLAGLWLSNTDEPLFIADASADARLDEKAKNIYAEMNTQASVIIPLTQGGYRVGFLTLNWTEAHEFSEWEVAVYTALIDLAASAVAAHRMAQDVRVKAEELTVLNELGQALTTRLNVDQVLDEAYRGASRLLDTTNFYVAFYDPDKDEVTFAFNAAQGEVRRSYQTRQAGQGLTEYIIHNRMPLLMQGDLPGQMEELGIEMIGQTALSWLGAPLIVGERVLGVMAVQSYTTPHLYDEHDQDLLTAIASQAAIALQNAQMVENLEQMVADRTRELRESLEEHERLQQEIIEAQKRAIQELSTPVIPVMERVIVMPLIGSIDTLRAKDVMRTLLAGISAHRAKVVILDVTGVPIVDSGVANHLHKTIQAARLKGARTIVTGISDAVAETIVDLGIDWSGIETLSDLRTGLRTVLQIPSGRGQSVS
jgi:anti-anti-sigma regulatory factor/K+-sensing histidine kinase KdpD